VARDLYQNTVNYVDSTTGAVKPVVGAQVYVYSPGTTNVVSIFQAVTGAATGGTASSGVTGTNPLTVGATGLVEFYADAGEYDIRIMDPNGRIADRTFRWNSAPMADAAIPSAKIAPDGNINLAELGADVLRQSIPVGTVIEWWRPANTVPIPTGFEICDGRIITSANHDFGTGASITLPDLRGVFILGADTPDAPVDYRRAANGRSSDLGGAYVGEASAAAAGDPGIPGIRGAGGSHAHTHTVPAHYHSAIGHGHNMRTEARGGSAIPNVGMGNGFNGVLGDQFSGAGGGDYGIATAGGNGSFQWAIGVEVAQGGTVGNTGGANGDATMTSGSTDAKLRYVGLLRLMKVKRS
jgi:hypothetical protein